MTVSLAAWRAQRTQSHVLSCGLTVIARKVQLMDLAARGEIPAPLYAQVEALMGMAEQGGGRVELSDFREHAAVINLVCMAAVVSPPIAVEPSETHVGIEEIPFVDRLAIFNWAQEEASQVATFPGNATGNGSRPARGRERVRPAAQQSAAQPLDGLADRPDGAGSGDAGDLPYTAPDGERIGRGVIHPER